VKINIVLPFSHSKSTSILHQLSDPQKRKRNQGQLALGASKTQRQSTILTVWENIKTIWFRKARLMSSLTPMLTMFFTRGFKWLVSLSATSARLQIARLWQKEPYINGLQTQFQMVNNRLPTLSLIREETNIGPRDWTMRRIYKCKKLEFLHLWTLKTLSQNWCLCHFRLHSQICRYKDRQLDTKLTSQRHRQREALSRLNTKKK